jgi:hypothetical protein
MHKRSTNKLQERKINRIILSRSHYDKRNGETISKLTREEVIEQLKEPLDVQLVPDIEKGEVLLDPRVKGSRQ